MFSVKKKLHLHVPIKVNSKFRVYTMNAVDRASNAEQNLGPYRKRHTSPSYGPSRPARILVNAFSQLYINKCKALCVTPSAHASKLRIKERFFWH